MQTPFQLLIAIFLILALSACSSTKQADSLTSQPAESALSAEPAALAVVPEIAQPSDVVEAIKLEPAVKNSTVEAIALQPSKSYHLNYLTDFSILALIPIEAEASIYGVSSALHLEHAIVNELTKSVSMQLDNSTLQINIPDASITNHYILYLAVDIELNSPNSEQFSVFATSSVPLKALMNSKLVLTLDSQLQLAGSGSTPSPMPSIPFTLQSTSPNRLLLKLLVSSPTSSLKLLLRPLSSASLFKLSR